MIDIAQLATVIQSAVGMVVLAVLVLRLWPGLLVDEFRQGMFEVRDELFDYAASGKISFSDPGYKLLRQSMNGFLQYAHRLTFFRLCLTIWKWRISGEEPELTWTAKWTAALKAIPDHQVRVRLRGFHGRALALVLRRLISGSPVLWCLLLVIVIAAILRTGWTNIKQLFFEAASTAVSTFVDPRLLEEAAARHAA